MRIECTKCGNPATKVSIADKTIHYLCLHKGCTNRLITDGTDGLNKEKGYRVNNDLPTDESEPVDLLDYICKASLEIGTRSRHNLNAFMTSGMSGRHSQLTPQIMLTSAPKPIHEIYTPKQKLPALKPKEMKQTITLLKHIIDEKENDKE